MHVYIKMSTTGVQWRASTGLTAAVILLGIIYEVIDPGYTALRGQLQAIFTLQIISLCVCIGILLHSDGPKTSGASLRNLSKGVAVVGLVLWIPAMAAVSIEINHCTHLASHDREAARRCIDVYSDYHPLETVIESCGVLNADVEGPMGLCPNVRLSNNKGKALMATQLVCLFVIACMEIWRFSLANKYSNDSDDHVDSALPALPVGVEQTGSSSHVTQRSKYKIGSQVRSLYYN